MAAEAFAFHSKNHPVLSPPAWFVPNVGNGAIVFLVGLAVELAAELVLAVVLPAAAAVVTAKRRLLLGKSL